MAHEIKCSHKCFSKVKTWRIRKHQYGIMSQCFKWNTRPSKLIIVVSRIKSESRRAGLFNQSTLIHNPRISWKIRWKNCMATVWSQNRGYGSIVLYVLLHNLNQNFSPSRDKLGSRVHREAAQAGHLPFDIFEDENWDGNKIWCLEISWFRLLIS